MTLHFGNSISFDPIILIARDSSFWYGMLVLNSFLPKNNLPIRKAPSMNTGTYVYSNITFVKENVSQDATI